MTMDKTTQKINKNQYKLIVLNSHKNMKKYDQIERNEKKLFQIIEQIQEYKRK